MHERQRTVLLALLALSLTIGCDTPKKITPKTQKQPSKERNTSAELASTSHTKTQNQPSNKHNTSAQPTSTVLPQPSEEQKHSAQPTKTANTSTNTEGSKAGRAGFLAEMSDAVKTLKDEHKAPEAKVNTLVNIVSQIGTSLDNKTKLLKPSEDVEAVNNLVQAAFDALYKGEGRLAYIKRNKAALERMDYDKLNAALGAMCRSKRAKKATHEEVSKRRLGHKLIIYLIECAHHNGAIPAAHSSLYKRIGAEPESKNMAFITRFSKFRYGGLKSMLMKFSVAISHERFTLASDPDSLMAFSRPLTLCP